MKETYLSELRYTLHHHSADKLAYLIAYIDKTMDELLPSVIEAALEAYHAQREKE